MNSLRTKPRRPDLGGRAPWLAVPGGLALIALVPPAVPASPPFARPAAFAPLPADAAGDRALLAELGAAFRKHHTARFSIISSADAEPTARLAATVEDTFEAVCKFAARLRAPAHSPAAKMTVVFFGDWESYAARARRGGFHVTEVIPGFFDERSNRCILFNYAGATLIRDKRREIRTARAGLTEDEARTDPQDRSARRRREERLRRIQALEAQLDDHERLINMTVIRHEVAHQVLLNLGLQPQGDLQRRWLKEGLAMQFETMEPVNGHRLADFLSIDRPSIPGMLRHLIADPKVIGPGAERAQQAYGIAWALVYYLAGEHAEAFGRYLRTRPTSAPARADPGPQAIAAFEAAFGRLDAAFEARWRRYVEGLAPRKQPGPRQ